MKENPIPLSSLKQQAWAWQRYVPIATLIFVFCAFSLLSDAFLTDRNLTNLARQVSVNCILAFGMTLIILLGAIDLSVGSLMALGTIVAALLQVNLGLGEMGWMGAVITWLALMMGCGLAGAGTGALVSRLAMPSFVVTLGMLVIARGLALIFSDGSKIGPLGHEYRVVGTEYLSPEKSVWLIGALGVCLLGWIVWNRALGKQLILPACVGFGILAASLWIFAGFKGIPVPVFLMLAVFGILYFVLNHTVYGRSLYAVGGNAEAARLCGIRVAQVQFWAFCIMGVLVALAAAIEGSRIDAGDPNAGQLYELDAIAAVVIGGTSLQGGVGSLQGTLLGALLIGTLNNGMSLMNVPTHYQMVIKGLIIVLAVMMDVVSKRHKN